ILTAGATAHSISPQPVWQFDNALKCTIPFIQPFSDFNYYGCYCGYITWNNRLEILDRCCQTQEHCYDQVKNMKNCKFFKDKTYNSSYLFAYSGNEIICSDKNTCEDFICNCDRQAAICFFKAL
ncbi:Phospholipase A2, partial [Cricetulus griseus]